MQWRPCRRHSCQNSGLLLLKTCVSNTCGPTFYNHFVLCGNFCDCRCNGAMTTPLFSSKKYGMAQCHQPDPVRLPQPAPGSATPTSTVHAFFRCTRWLSTFHRGARPVFTRPSKSEREHDLSSKALSFSKERMRKRDRERVRASMTGESSRAYFSWLRFIAERNLPSQSSTELEQKS